MRWSLCSVVCVGALVGGACAVPQRHADASWRRLEDMGRAGLKETVKAKMAAEGELEVRDENGTVVLYETVEERIEGRARRAGEAETEHRVDHDVVRLSQVPPTAAAAVD